jgi:large subunit ribosomal protein L28e
MSGELIWELIKGNNSFLVKRDGHQFSSEKGNLRNLNSYKYSGLANPKAIDISPVAGGITVSIKSQRKADARRPVRLFQKLTLNKLNLKRDFRRVAKAISNQTAGRYYRPDLRLAALARWTNIHRSLTRGPAKPQRPRRKYLKARRAAKKPNAVQRLAN